MRGISSFQLFYGRRGVLCALFLCALLAAQSGCGPSGPTTVPVKGSVTKDGQPLALVVVTLMGTDGDYVPTGETDSSGNFEIALAPSGKKGAAPGKYKVILAGGGTPTVAGTQGSPNSPYGSDRSGRPVAEKPYGKEWTSAETSPLEVEVVSGMAPIEIKL